jgi:hypothetical protein
MDLKQEVDRLFNLFNEICEKACESRYVDALSDMHLNDILFIYHKDVGQMMFYNGLWHTDEYPDHDGLKLPLIRETICSLIKENKITLFDIEKMIFTGV